VARKGKQDTPNPEDNPSYEDELEAYEGIMFDGLTEEDIKAIFPPGNPGELKVTAEEWKSDWAAGVQAMSDRWKRRTVGTRKDVIKLGAEAEPKYRSKTTEAIRLESRRKALERTTTDEWREMVRVTDPTEYATGATKRSGKFGKKVDLQYDLRVYAKSKMDAMPEETDPQREKKMLAARRTNITIGKFIKGIIDAATARREIDAATAAV